MLHFIAFFPVDNSLEYVGSDFNGLTEKEIIDKLRDLKRSGDQVRFYNLSNYDYSRPFPNSCPFPTIANLVEDYNAEELDGGWFCTKFKWFGTEDELWNFHIGEYGLDDITRKVEAGEVMTDKELVEEGIVSTKNSIRTEIKQYYPNATDEWIDKHDLIDDIIQSCSWEYTSTKVDQMGDWDIWDDYPKD